jgi:hypothetical protein
MVGLFLLGWLLFFRLTLSDTVSELRLMRAPHYTAVVERETPGVGGSPLLLHWRQADGTDRYGTVEAEDQYTLGQHVRVLDYTTPTCQSWTTAREESGILPTIVGFLFVIPVAAIVAYVIHRRRWWLRVLRSTEDHRPGGRVTGMYEFGHRQGVTVDGGGRPLYVPLLRGQFVTALTSYDSLKPLQAHQRNVIPFRVAGTDRIVWPSGQCRRHLVPYGPIAVRLLFFGGPALLALAVHLATAPVAPC